jgi:hypothetical protein
MNELYSGCYTAEWQSSDALQEMMRDPEYADTGPDQEAAMRSVVVANYDEAFAYLQTVTDQVYRTAQICGPWHQTDARRWEYDRIWSEIELN